MSRVAAIALDPGTYQRHPLHHEDQVWVEKNCYIDVWIELLHALGLDPAAMLPFVIAVDFEGDQVTFFKPAHGELWDLYGVDVQELNVWRPLLEHALEQVGAGKVISTEADAFWLPDTQGTDYRRQHTKTTIIITDVNVEARRLGYFHNASYHGLEGEDFVQTFRLGFEPDPTFMPLFAEVVRFDRKATRPRAELVTASRALLERHRARRPTTNPVVRFGERFTRELADLQARGLAHYHAWAFANIRQLGAAAELAAYHHRWTGDAALEPRARAWDTINNGCKALILKVARAVNSRKPLDATALFAEMSAAWELALSP
jgi:hypothetical protein